MEGRLPKNKKAQGCWGDAGAAFSKEEHMQRLAGLKSGFSESCTCEAGSVDWEKCKAKRFGLDLMMDL